MFDLKDMGLRIKHRRLELDMTQDELAKATGYTSRSSINKIELGKVDVTQSKIVAIAEALSISPVELMGYSTPNKQIVKNTENTFLTEHEKSILKAYRAHPEVRFAIDSVLGIPDEYTELYEAAHSNDMHPPKIVQLPKENWERIANAPETDDDLK